ncbi:hypothetical protein ACIO13_35675 [Streptomyces sp. NPDC087425]|uniref:hypothetical protein n=1 Tax=Streptomyces sp. NPDC087425 TaxID=3365787 RepID=UPI0037F84EB8
MNRPDHLAAVEIHHPQPLTPTTPAPTTAPLVPVQPHTVPPVASIVLPDGRIITGYAISPVQPEPVPAKPPVSRAAVNIALGGIGFGAVCAGLFVLTAFITALTALITQLIVLAAVIVGGLVAVRVVGGSSRDGGGTTVNIRKAVIKRSHFHG